ncbi:MAG: SDR family NAD(P)-dependent oxidoreductase, partial [Pseudomonadota bacterium]
ADLTDRSALEDLCAALEGADTPPAVAFVNAGIIEPGPSIDLPRASIDRHIDINLRAAAHLNHALARAMVAAGGGHIISTLSAAAMVALPDSAAYSASKFGLRGYLISLAEEVRDKGVTISCLYPNAIDTPMLRYEALHGGSVLNFLTPPLATDEVIKALAKAQKSKRLEYFIPPGDGWSNRLVTSFPGLVRRLYPALLKRGEKGRRHFIEKNGLAP